MQLHTRLGVIVRLTKAVRLFHVIVNGTIDVANNNLIGDANSAGNIVNGVNGNKVGNQPSGTGTIPIATVLAPLANNGGPTQTHALVPNSPAIDMGNSALLPPDTFDLDMNMTTVQLPVDQRGVGFPRIQGAI